MAILDHRSRLTKELKLFHVYALATGATLSSGLFLLPGLAAEEVGPAVLLSYLLAAVPLIPAMFSVIELGTAMPRAGGAYYFLDRSLGPLVGTIGGLGTWLALTLKTAFALVGLGAYLGLFLNAPPYWLIVLIACGLALLFGVVNLLGSRKTGRLQIAFVIGLLAILLWFIGHGSLEVDARNFRPLLGAGWHRILGTAGIVYISYVGVTNVASVSEEICNADRNLPRGLFLALGTAVVVYALCIVVMTGVLEPEHFAGSMTPMASAAEQFMGRAGIVLLSLAALLAFSSVANAGILSASRYPLAMSRDQLVPAALRKLGRRGTPTWSIALTVGAVLVYLVALDPLKIAELASAFQLLMFALICLAVIVMRESRIESYDPGFRSPLYPWMQLVGIAAPLLLIGEMGWLPIVFSTGMIVVGTVWYRLYSAGRVDRHGAVYHVFERLGRRRFEALDVELRGIMKERGLREHDPFVEIVAQAAVLDMEGECSFEALTRRAAVLLAPLTGKRAETLAGTFLEGTRIGATPVSHGAALPHLRLAGIQAPVMVIARCRAGLRIETADTMGEQRSSRRSFAVFFLVSPDGDPGQHLRLLAEMASRVDQEDFLEAWRAARDEQGLREVLLRHERYLALTVGPGLSTAAWADRAIREIDLPEGCLVAVIHRDGATIVPGGDTVLRAGDRLAIIGSEEAVRACGRRFGAARGDPGH